MAISFNCTGCGKHYEVNDNLAGKKGKCKQCGQMMVIPSPAPSAPALDDIYGLDEAPSVARAPEPLAPLLRRAGAATATEAAPVAKKKKKKSKGFFSFGSKSKSKGDGGGRTMAFGLGGGGFGMFLLIFVLRVALRTGLSGWGLMSKAEMEDHIKANIASFRQMAAILRKAHDGPTAESAVNEVLVVAQKMIDHDRSAKDKKGRKTDMEEVTARYSGEMQSSAAEFRNELMRVAMIPGAQGAVQRLANTLQEASKDLPVDENNAFALGMTGGPGVPQPNPPQASLPAPANASPPQPEDNPAPQMTPNPQPAAPGFPPTSNPNPNPGLRFGPRRFGPRMR